jgi:enterochelin esterase-like enzyme
MPMPKPKTRDVPSWLRTAAVAAFVTTTILPLAAQQGRKPHAGTASPTPGIRFEISFPADARAEAVTGRVYVAISRENNQRAPIQQVGPTGVPLFSHAVEALRPGQTAVIDARDLGHPMQSLRDLPPGEYWVQAFVNVYTRFTRADGHTVWLHMDQWEGQQWNRSPGNLFSEPVKLRIDPKATAPVKLVCDKVIPPVQAIPDTEYVKRVRLQSEILTKWWGHPIFLGATVLLPKDYDKHPDVRYPVNYIQGHFSTWAPGGFGSGREFDKFWQADTTPRMIYVTLLHPSPYYDDSYGVNSANNGPYGDAIMQELIPAIEKEFRIIGEPWARVQSGGSTGGWIAAAHQVFYPDFYGATFASCPDSVDFRAHQIVNIYDDENAYWLTKGWTKVERPNRRRPDGNVDEMMKDENWYELVVGDHARSGGQWDIWEATYGPVGADGYPKPIWDKRTGTVDKDVAAYWKKNYDLRAILEANWATLGPKLANKLNVYVGDMDSFYLNNGVHMLDTFLKGASHPAFGGEVLFQPLAPHCWGPRGSELHQKIVAHIEKMAPAGAELRAWKY